MDKETQFDIENYTKELVKKHLDTLKQFNNDQCVEIPNIISNDVCVYIKNKNYEGKFLVTVTLFEKGNMGLILSGTSIWDKERDFNLKIEDSNEFLTMVVSIWKFAIN